VGPLAAVTAARSLTQNPAMATMILRGYVDHGDRRKPIEQSFSEDLATIEAKVKWAMDGGHSVVTFDVNNGTN